MGITKRLHTRFSTHVIRLVRDLLRRLGCAIAATGLLMGSAGTNAAPPVDQQATTIHYVKGRVLLQPRAGLSDAQLDKLLKPHGGKRVGQIKQINVHVIQLPEQANEIELMQALKKNPHIQFAELDVAVQSSIIPNDPWYSKTYHLPLIGSPTAWDSSTGTGVTIAILDSGVESTHPDLQPALVAGWNTYDNNSDTTPLTRHGTVCAGAAAAVGNNALGAVGVAWQSKIMPIRVTSADGWGYWSTIANGIIWAADHGARAASASFGDTCGSATVANAAQYMRNKGGIVTIAAGNTGALIADAPNSAITCVVASDVSDEIANYSSFGDAVDITAPGNGIVTTDLGGTYATPSGTSMATPVAAGVYALMISANKSLSAATLDSILFSTAKDLGDAGWDRHFGYGRVDAAAAVARAKSTIEADTQAPTVSITAPLGGSKVSGLVGVNVTATDNTAVTKVDLYANGSLVGTDLLAPFQFAWDASGVADGAATLVAKASDSAGNVGSSPSIAVTVANDTIAPIVTIANPQAGSTVSGVVNVSVTALDNVKVAKITLTIDGRDVAQAFGSSLSYSWDAGSSTKSGKGRKTGTTSTTSSISARAEDPAANVGTATVSVKR